MEILGSSNAAAAFQANVSSASSAQEPRALQEQNQGATQQSSGEPVSISNEARALFEAEQSGGQGANTQSRSGA